MITNLAGFPHFFFPFEAELASGTAVDLLSGRTKICWKEHDIVAENDTSHVTLLLLWLCFLSIWAHAVPLSTL